MKRKAKIVIIGTGFMGGSIARAVKTHKLNFFSCGVARNKAKAVRIAKLRVFDEVTHDLSSALNDANMVVLCTPVSSIIEYIKAIGPFLKKDAVVTDVGSTKKDIVSAGEKYLEGRFIGSHPICGIEKGGVKYSVADLFNGNVCVVTTERNNSAVRKVKNLWKSLKAKTVCLQAGKHDEILSYTSALPHILSYAFTSAVPLSCKPYKGGSFRGLSRVSASPGEMWADIFLTNRKQIKKSGTQIFKELNKIFYLIENNDREKLVAFLKKINKKYKTLDGK